MPDDEEARREQAKRWREEIEAAKSGRSRPPASPREFTDPDRRDQPQTEGEDPNSSEDDSRRVGGAGAAEK